MNGSNGNGNYGNGNYGNGNYGNGMMPANANGKMMNIAQDLAQAMPSMAGGANYSSECQFQGAPQCRTYCQPAAFHGNCGYFNLSSAYGASRQCNNC